MGRIRTVKPEILEDEKTASLTHLEWRLFVSLFLIADDYGILRGDPGFIRGTALWSSRESREDVAKAIETLASVALVLRYKHRGQVYMQISNWDKHQKIDRPSKRRLPTHDDKESKVYPHDAESSRKARETLDESSRDPRANAAIDLDLDQGSGSGIKDHTEGAEDPAHVRVVPDNDVDAAYEQEIAQEALSATQTTQANQAAPPVPKVQPKPRQSVGAIAASAPSELTRPDLEPPPEALTLAQLLLDYVCKNHPQTRLANSPDRVKELTVLRWGNTIRKLHAIDRIEYVQIAGMIHWSQRHSWWKASILSAEKLREKFDTMQAQRKRPKAGDVPTPDPVADAERAAATAREREAWKAEVREREEMADADRDEVAEGLTELKQKLGIVP